MQDITQYSDSELSDWFMNDEGLYNTLLRSTWKAVKELAQELFVFTSDQLDELKETYEENQDE